MGLTVYFWVVTAVLLFLGTTVFKRLRPHFAVYYREEFVTEWMS